MKKIVLFTSLLLIIVLLSSCYSASSGNVDVISPASSSPAQTTSSPTPQTSAADSERIILTNKQNYEIDALLTGALSMFEDHGDAAFFQDTSTLTANELLRFAYIILNDIPDSIGRDYMEVTGTVSSNEIENIIHSAFGIDYKPQTGDCNGEFFQYNGDSFIFEGSDGPLTYPCPYSVTRQPSGNLMVRFNMIYDNVPGTEYMGKGEAVLQEDVGSLFGYQLVSLTKTSDTDITFTDADSSSYLPADGSKTFAAANAIDSDESTAWAARDGKGDWIKLSFDKTQDTTALILHFGDRSGDDAFEEHALPASIRLDFSDGTSLKYDDFEVYDITDDTFVGFDKVISTSYVKITIIDITEGTDDTDNGVYVSEIIPF